MRPFLRWAGCKRQLVPTLSQFWSDRYSRYVEPFAGSACLFFHLVPKQAILGDINRDLIDTYKEIKYRPSVVSSHLRRFPLGKRSYLRLRSLDLASKSSSVRAARLIYLNRYCFNGLYRTNQQGRFNVPYGGTKVGALPSLEMLKQCSAVLKKARLVPGDFEKVLKQTKEGDFVYMDPPFSVKGYRVFNEYDSSVFSREDVERLRNWLTLLDKKGIPFLVSYADSAEADFLRRGFQVKTVTAKRNIAGFADKRVRVNEFLIFNSHASKQ